MGRPWQLFLWTTFLGAADSRAPLVTPDQLPLATSSRWIIDRRGHRVKWSCVNWAGADQKDGVPGGLQHNDAGAIAHLIAQWGFNCVRIPWSVWMVKTNPVVSDMKLLGANPALMGKRALSILDDVVSACVQERLMVILDNHMSDGEWCCSEQDGNGLWHNQRWAEAAWVESHVEIATRYRKEQYVVAVELRNELRGALFNGSLVQPTWGSGDMFTDWRGAALRASAAILNVRPSGLLIVVDGLAYSTDLRAIAQHPIQLAVPNRLVYSAHDYLWPMYNGLSKAQHHAQLRERWGYLLEEGHAYTAPVWVSEFGEWHDGRNYKHGWWPSILAYLEEEDLDFAYWRLDGTESRGTSRVFGGEAGFGIMNTSWSGPAGSGITLAALQRVQSPQLGPAPKDAAKGGSSSSGIVADNRHIERFGHDDALGPQGWQTAEFAKG